MSTAGEPVNLWSVLDGIGREWSPYLLGAVNDHRLKAVRVRGEFVWHSHPGLDELFVVLDGELVIDLREPGPGSPDGTAGADGTDGSDATVERAVALGPGDCFTVPADVPHRPRSVGGARILLVEPDGMVSTGDYDGPVPDHIDRTTGRRP
ncbi:cupin domain-containing protein [Aquipuribacter sp. SD81]|uniref:cupin domain-containing protein n=1 Tax=Aquipuribacter sp. SD81 TaxID=3127703 RepID=UPI0030164D2A